MCDFLLVGASQIIGIGVVAISITIPFLIPSTALLLNISLIISMVIILFGLALAIPIALLWKLGNGGFRELDKVICSSALCTSSSTTTTSWLEYWYWESWKHSYGLGRFAHTHD